MKLTMELKGNGLNSLSNLLTETPKKLPKELASVTNKVAKAHVKAISKRVRTEISITNKDALKSILNTKKATASDIQSKILIRKEFRPSLKYFKARQTKKGVSYKISKKGKRQKIGSAFISEKIGGHVYKRMGKSRLPIQKLKGPSIWGVYVKNEMIAWSREELGDEFGRQVQRRTRAIIVNSIKRKGRVDGLSEDEINARIKEQTANL